MVVPHIGGVVLHGLTPQVCYKFATSRPSAHVGRIPSSVSCLTASEVDPRLPLVDAPRLKVVASPVRHKLTMSKGYLLLLARNTHLWVVILRRWINLAHSPRDLIAFGSQCGMSGTFADTKCLNAPDEALVHEFAS